MNKFDDFLGRAIEVMLLVVMVVLLISSIVVLGKAVLELNQPDQVSIADQCIQTN